MLRGSPGRFRPRPRGPGRFLWVLPEYRYSGRFPASCLRAACTVLRLPGRVPILGLAAPSGSPRDPPLRPFGPAARFPFRVLAQRPKTLCPFPRDVSSRFDPQLRIPLGRKVEAEAPPYRPFAFPSPGGLGSRWTAVRKVGSGFRFRVGLALLPSARPAFPSIRSSPCGPSLSSVQRSRAARFVSEEPRPGTRGSCHALPSRPSGIGLWITGISGVTWINRGTPQRGLRNRSGAGGNSVATTGDSPLRLRRVLVPFPPP
jgi:hypothetical protein